MTTEQHSCKVTHTHLGYAHAIVSCMTDLQGRMWVIDTSGRRATQVSFCPFCGVQALNLTQPEHETKVTPADIALVGPDKPQAQWKVYKTELRMYHFQFGNVRILASNGCHAKVLTHDKQQMTVCVENLEEIKGVPMLPKVGKKEPKPKKDRTEEMVNKYLNMGL